MSQPRTSAVTLIALLMAVAITALLAVGLRPSTHQGACT